jgi:hypothetical protein
VPYSLKALPACVFWLIISIETLLPPKGISLF